MATSPMAELIQHLCRSVVLGDGAGLTDGQLLDDFVCRHDQTALATLVVRHSPMVWGVCRRVLDNHHDAEDAFQATFLVLVRKARSVRPREMVANWLYGVARQTALKARATSRTRKGRESQVVEMPDPAAPEPDHWHDLQPVLDEELSRLPDKYRTVVVLSDLEGKTRKEVAQQLGVPEGTVAGWVARARAMLAKRLSQRGIALSGATLAAIFSRNAASANAPALVVSSTIKAASLFAAGHAATVGTISARVAALTQGVLKTMLMAKLKNVTAMLFVAAAIGAGLLGYGIAAGQQGDAKSNDSAAIDKQDGKPKAQKDVDAIQGTWYVKAMEEAGKPQPKEQFEDVKMRLVVTGDQLAIMTTNPAGRDFGEKGLTIKLDDKASPKRLDASKNGKTILGIYSFERGELRICIDMSGASRPANFKTTEGSEQRSYVLQKLAPAK